MPTNDDQTTFVTPPPSVETEDPSLTPSPASEQTALAWIKSAMMGTPILPASLAWGVRVVAEARQPNPRNVGSRSFQRVPFHAAVDRLKVMFGPALSWSTDFDGEVQITLLRPTWTLTLRGYPEKARVEPDPWVPARGLRHTTQARVHGKAMVTVAFFGQWNGLDADPDLVKTLTMLGEVTPWDRFRTGPFTGRRPRQIGLITQVGGGGLEIQDHSIPRGRFVRDNYPDHVGNAYDRVKAFCRKRKMGGGEGRLVLIDGPPGTGKTSLIRGLLREAPAPYVLATGLTVASLASPGFIPFIMSTCRDRNGLVLILEDADEVIASRDFGENVGLLSLLLNATSGILADLTNLRVIATINQWNETRVDPAVLRAGRLFERISIPELTVEHARQIVLRESGGNEIMASRVTEPVPLARCYEIAKGAL